MRARFSLTVALSAVASIASAQSRPCLLQLDSGGMSRSIEVRKGIHHTFGSGGVSGHCRGEETTMRADSAAWYTDLDRLDMVGHAVFQDTMVRLEAHRAVYYLRRQRLEAFGNVTLLNRKTGSLLSGPTLTYTRAAGSRDNSELVATQRPRAEYRAENDVGGEPYHINADRMRFQGSSKAWAGGGVRVRRTDFSATSDSAQLDLSAGDGLFVGHAEVRGQDSAGYVLTGRSIRYRMEKNRLVWVQARGTGDATSNEWRLVADTVEFDVADQRVNGGRAWGDSLRPRAVSRSYTILADSLALDAPDQRLTEVRGLGRGYATSRSDSARTDPDWMAGDTIVARFDSTMFSRSSLVVLKALGAARAYYHVADPKRPAAPGISYSRGAHIAAHFTPLGLDRVDVVGNSDGVFLEPGPPPPPPPTKP